MINGPLSGRGVREEAADLSSGVSSIGVHVAPPLRILIMPSEEAENRAERSLATDALLYFVNVSIDHRMLLGFAPFYCPSPSIPHAHYGASRLHC